MNSQDSLLAQGTAAFRAGDVSTARNLFSRAVRQDPNSEAAWLWLSAVLKTPQGRAFCLRRVLALNPVHPVARRGLAALERIPPAPALVARPLRRRTGQAPGAALPQPAPGALRQLLRRPQLRTSAAEGTLARTLSRVARYTIVRTAALLVAVTIAVYLTIVVANLGGYVDEIIKSRIDLQVAGAVLGGWLRDKPTEEKFEIIEQTIEEMRQAAGIYEPFVVRCLRWLRHGLTLDWGEAKGVRVMLLGRPSREVKDIILDTLPRTLLVFGIANFCLFGTSVFLALALTRKHGGWLDKAVIALSPMSAAPAWVVGILLNVLLYRVLGIISLGGTLDSWPDEFKLAYIPHLLKYLTLPFLAIFLSGLFQSIYAWRTFFLIYSSEDHVEIARAKGLPRRMMERRYILRPVLPTVLTGFALLLMGLWQEVIALELFFNITGIGRLFWMALYTFDIPVILGLVVTFAYLLAVTVFILDISYALIDPRVRVGSQRPTAEAAFRKRKLRIWPERKHRTLPRPAWSLPPGSGPPRAKISFPDRLRALGGRAASLKATLRALTRYPSAVIGLAIIAALIALSIYTVIAIPYGKALWLWSGNHSLWERNPENAVPAWVNRLRRVDLPPTIVLDTRDPASASLGVADKTVTVVSDEMTEVTLSFSFDYPYGALPQDLVLYVEAHAERKMSQLSLTWLRPDGREIDLGTYSVRSALTYYPDQDDRLRKREGKSPLQALFANPSSSDGPLQGRYELRVDGLLFEETAELDAELVLYGRVYGPMGTDGSGRDLTIPLLWGAPIALAFGLVAAVGTSVSTMTIAGIGVWYGGWVDGLVQRITEVNMILPFLPVSIMIYTLYSNSFWVVMGVTIGLSVFGSAIKNYRAIFLQIKEAPYIEAARSYGAGNWRIIFRYLVPRISAVLIPQIVILVPGYVFLEATLTFVGVGVSGPPTWGQLVVEMLFQSTYAGQFALVLVPLGLLLLTGFAFAMVGMALERFFEPRLRDR